ncbi:MAG: DNA-protecting protein DprA [Candidatus Omnitrophica bacterium CG11_big_fil_rev_8_21_14_0_20_41_12]|nr:MAG: DNA-protecting protein DprA [Candidatus Omnitrophica bacterium CG11_big_fil_rev_8_21_14_0_20_41_12]
MNNLEALVSLNLIPQIGSVCLENLLKYFQQPQDIFKAGRKDLVAAAGERLGENIVSFDTRLLAKDLLLAKKSGIKIITLFCQDYPRALKDIPGKPIVLYVLGDITEQDNLAFGIVGSRRASLYGLNSATTFASQLSAYGITIVSGMARGVDTYAHRGALKVKGRTIAVMGSGFNNIYPEENADLAKEISLSGAVVSEFPMEAEPLPMNFPRRNRIISGLSRGILITEAARNSGALITADFALEQGREVFALPGRIDSCGSSGTNTLLKQGAKLVTCCDDILEELNLVVSYKTEPDKLPAGQKIAGTDDESRVYDCISREPVAIDDLVEKTAFSSSKILSLILKLRFKKLIRELPGKQFMRN